MLTDFNNSLTLTSTGELQQSRNNIYYCNHHNSILLPHYRYFAKIDCSTVQLYSYSMTFNANVMQSRLFIVYQRRC